MLLEELEATEQSVVQMADNMVAGATEMGSMGYDLLISSREELKRMLHFLVQQAEKTS